MQAKRWCFTINNPTEEDRELLLGTPSDGPQANFDAVQYMVFQEERAPTTGTLHWQGFLILKDKKRLTWLKRNINPRANWSIARGNNEQCRDYCRKEETYTGGERFEYGELPTREVKKASERLQDAADELDSVKDGYKRPSDISSITLMQSGFLAAYKELTSDILGPWRKDLQVVTLIGPPGTGKSYAINTLFPGHGRCIMGNNGIWFQNPLAEVMVFEEFCGQIQLQRMLQFLDQYPLALEIKGGMRPAMYNLVIITSNTPPIGWYRGEEVGAEGKRTDAIKALWDRLGYTCGSYIPVRTTGHYFECPSGLTIDEARQWFMEQLGAFVESGDTQVDAPIEERGGNLPRTD